MTIIKMPDTAAAAFPLQNIFVPFPFVCFTLAFLTDAAFWGSANLMWQNFSSWLLFAGLVVGGVAVVAGLLDLLRPRTRPLRAAVVPTVFYLLAMIVALLNSFVHARDGWTAVVPSGLALSAVTFLLLLVAACFSTRKYYSLIVRI